MTEDINWNPTEKNKLYMSYSQCDQHNVGSMLHSSTKPGANLFHLVGVLSSHVKRCTYLQALGVKRSLRYLKGSKHVSMY